MTSDKLIVTVNGVENSVSVETSEPDQIATKIEPQNLSPVLEANLTVTLSDAYDIQLEVADFAAELILVSETT
jgi:hypothetical protein